MERLEGKKNLIIGMIILEENVDHFYSKIYPINLNSVN